MNSCEPRPFKEKTTYSASGAIAGTIFTYPIDFAKTRLQYQTGSTPYRNTGDCWRIVRSREGIRSIYRGCLISILLVGPDRLLKLFANETLKNTFRTQDNRLPRPRRLLIYAVASGTQSVITCPMDLLKIQMQMYGIARSEQFKPNRASVFLYAKEVIQQRGVLGLYRGFSATFLRDVTFTTLYLPWFFLFRDAGPVEKCTGRTTFWWSSIVAFGAAGIGVVASQPFDVFKTRQQVVFPPDDGVFYGGSLRNVIAKSCADDGLGACFTKGLMGRLVVVSTMFALTQWAYQSAYSGLQIFE